MAIHNSLIAKTTWGKVLIFVFLSYAISWAVWWPILDDLAGFDGDPSSVSPIYFVWLTVGAAGPSISALIVLHVFEGRSALRDTLSRVAIWRFRWGWYCFALLVVPCSDLVARLLFSSFYPDRILVDLDNAAALLLVVPFAFVSGSLTEELGWRGYLQPTLRKQLSVFATGVVIGVVWGLWHTPLFFTQVGSFVSGTGPTVQAIVYYLIFSILLSWCMAWQGEYTRQSLLIAYLFHLSLNLAIGPVLMAPKGPESQTALILLCSGILLLTCSCVMCLHRKKTLSHPDAYKLTTCASTANCTLPRCCSNLGRLQNVGS